MLNVQNYRVAPQVAFKGEENNSSKPYQTHAGLKTGIGYSLIGTGLTLGVNSFGKFVTKVGEEAAKEMEGAEKAELKQTVQGLKSVSKKLGITIPIMILTSLGCGAIVDKLINDKQKAFAQKLDENGKKEVLDTEDSADTTRKGEVYCRSSIGKKVGTLLGAVAYPVLVKTNSAIAKVKSPVGIVGGAIMGALGGLMLGAITDSVANSGARKHADKQAIANKTDDIANVEEAKTEE